MQFHHPVILSWDWKEQPDLLELAEAIHGVSGGTVHLHQVDTGSSDYAIVLAAEPLDERQVADVYEHRWDGETS
jgi:hypothetical protein